MSQTTITVGETTATVETRAIRNIPVLNAIYAHGQPIDIKLPWVQMSHMLAVIKIMSGGTVRPMTDLSSHKDVYLVIRFARELEICTRLILDGFAGWTSYHKWRDLGGIEYMYMLYMLAPELVNFAKYFALDATNVSKMRDIAACTRELSPANYIDNLALFQGLNFMEGFDGTGTQIKGKIMALERARAEIGNLFIINPWEHSDYFAYTPRCCDLWSCDGISIYKRPSPGDALIVSEEEFNARFAKFTRGMVTKCPSDTPVEFPAANVVFAGGSITKLISAEYSEKIGRSSDLDIFVIGKSVTEKDETVEALLRWFKTPSTYYATTGSVTSVFMVDVPRVFQIISNTAKTPFDVVDRFDMTHIGWFVHEGKLRCTAHTAVCMRHKLAQFTRIGRLMQDRIIKALYNGYDIEKDPNIVANVVDITELLREPNGATISGIVKSFQAWYYPRSDPMLDDDELNSHLAAEIEEKARAQKVTRDWTAAKSTMVVNGNFESYSAPPFNAFDLSQVIVLAALKHKQNQPLATKLGAVRLSSDNMTVSRINIDEDAGITLTLIPSLEFIAWVRRVEDDIYPKYRNNRVNKRVINDNGEFVYNISKKRLEQQAGTGRSLLKDSRGEFRDIETELRASDIITINFGVRVIAQRWNDNGNHILINVHTFTSYSLDPIESADIECGSGDPDAEPAFEVAFEENPLDAL